MGLELLQLRWVSELERLELQRVPPSLGLYLPLELGDLLRMPRLGVSFQLRSWLTCRLS